MADEARRLTPYLGPAGAWALALGSSIGWGSLVITSSTYLAQAGPVGSLLGTLAGGLVMLIIARNYHYMMNCCPEAGGAYAYARSCFGHDHGFLVAWFLALTYLAIFWANATALPLFARYFLGGLFQVGKLYTIFGYDIFLGEVLLTAGAIGLFSLVCTGSKKATALLMLGFAICFTLAVTVCFLWAASSAPAFDPPFVPDAAVLSQVAKIAIISPWAFIGFENISHATEEFSFKPTRSFRVLVAAVITTTALYAFITLLSATAWPAQFDSWFDYIRHLDQLNGIEGLPAFYAARHYMGQAGIVLLMAALLSLVLSSLIGNILSLSRLFYALAKDGILPRRFASLNRHSVPATAVLLVGCVSLATAFIGRTAIGWIVDVTTIGATLVYAFVSACAWKQADVQCDRLEKATGMAGVAIMVCFEAYLLAPNLFSASSMATESFFLFVLWSVFGLIFFRIILKRDGSGRFGHSLVVWISLLSLVLYVSLVWMNQSILTAASDGINAANSCYARAGSRTGSASQSGRSSSSSRSMPGVWPRRHALRPGPRRAREQLRHHAPQGQGKRDGPRHRPAEVHHRSPHRRQKQALLCRQGSGDQRRDSPRHVRTFCPRRLRRQRHQVRQRHIRPQGGRRAHPQRLPHGLPVIHPQPRVPYRRRRVRRLPAGHRLREPRAAHCEPAQPLRRAHRERRGRRFRRAAGLQ